MSAEGSEPSSHGREITSHNLKSDGLNAAENLGVAPFAIEWSRKGQNGSSGDMRLRYDPTYSGIGVDSVLAAGEECSLEDLEEERKLSGPEDGIAHAV